MLWTPPTAPEHLFVSAKTPDPIGYSSRTVRTTLIQLTLRPAVFVIRSEAANAGMQETTVTLVTECGDVLLDLRQVGTHSRAAAAKPVDPLRFVVTPQGIDRQPYADNCRLAWLCHDYLPDPRDRDKVLRVLAQERDLTLTQTAKQCRYSADPISVVLALVCADFAEADLETSPLGPATRIRARRRQGVFA